MIVHNNSGNVHPALYTRERPQKISVLQLYGIYIKQSTAQDIEHENKCNPRIFSQTIHKMV
jgi:hypothetical protein